MIPKKIHYCWFGGNPLSKLAKKCIKSWKKYCPDYEIIRWDEDNFDISKAPLYVRQAYEAKKWGFVTDYVRLNVVYNYGGIYLDTDVEVIKPLDVFLPYKGYVGFESDQYVNTGLGFGAEKGNLIIKELMESYRDIHFLKSDGTCDLTPCPVSNSVILKKLGFEMNGKMQNMDGFVVLPREYLNPVNNETNGVISKTENTVSIHHYASSWCDSQFRDRRNKVWKKNRMRFKINGVLDKVRYFPKRTLKKMIGDSKYEKIKRKLK